MKPDPEVHSLHAAGPHPLIALGTSAAHEAACLPAIPVGCALRTRRLAEWAQTAAQLALLVLLARLAEALTTASGIPVPSSVAGMLGLYLLLQTGVLNLEHVERCSMLLVRHLALYFVPVAVGLMAYGELLATAGAALLVALAVSAAVGMLVAGLLTQALNRRKP